ncbi:MAG: YlmC/YmxH family sporulation protein [Bacillota bacterium]|nr:YlmC/YmxH family sporulation protein [Bacillota bacterium]
MSEDIKLYSEIERYEIINVNDGEKYSTLSNNDIIIDEQGNLKYLILNETKSGFSFFNSKPDFSEVPWQYVKKIGTRTIIIDIEQDMLRESHI